MFRVDTVARVELRSGKMPRSPFVDALPPRLAKSVSPTLPLTVITYQQSWISLDAKLNVQRRSGFITKLN